MQPIENNVYYPFGPRGLYAKIFRSMGLPAAIILVVILLALAGGVVSDMVDAYVPGLFHYLIVGGIVAAAVLALFGAVIGWLRYVNCTFMVSDNALYLRNGVLRRTEISIPLRHMSNILQQQSIVDRVLGVCRCQIEIQADEVSAANTSTSVPDDVVLYDVDMDLIVPLRELLLSRSNTQRMVVVSK